MVSREKFMLAMGQSMGKRMDLLCWSADRVWKFYFNESYTGQDYVMFLAGFKETREQLTVEVLSR